MSISSFFHPRRHLPARKFHPVLRPQRSDFSPQVSWKQIVGADSQNFGKNVKFHIRHAPFLVFQPGDGDLAGIPAKQLQFYGKLVLRPALEFADLAHLRPNHVQLFRAVFYECTVTGDAPKPCSYH